MTGAKPVLNTIIIQPPLVQLNTPYPSGAYLISFFKDLYKRHHLEGCVRWLDLSNELFHAIFCRSGLRRIFEQSMNEALCRADAFERQGDDNSAFQLRRFVSQAELWQNWIDIIVSIVCPGVSGADAVAASAGTCACAKTEGVDGAADARAYDEDAQSAFCAAAKRISGAEFAHEFIRSAHAPRGARMEGFLASLQRDVCADDSKILASLALADLADYISSVYDSNFSLIRYAEHLAVSTATFDQAESGLDSPILNDFYAPIVQAVCHEYQAEPALFCVSVPFPGCFEAALFTARTIRSIPFFEKNALIAFGGGYINTELRSIAEPRLFKYCHFLSYDKGYGSYIHLFEKLTEALVQGGHENALCSILNGDEFYGIKYACGDKIIFPLDADSQKARSLCAAEHDIIRALVPDFSQIDFTRYPRLADDTNPMHRIWNDGSWIKAYMAHGCYWHRCAFCDTSLDYIKDFCATDIARFYDGIHAQAVRAGVFGIHFVDEACPPTAMKHFALLNCADTQRATMPTFRRLTWWGNIRFEKTFTRDLADLLSFGGLTAVSGGIEIATGTGLSSVNKGTDMENIVAACCAFKEAGILVHSYMIFGFWNQSEQDLIDSMETLRQLFAAGLLDSAFWHRFSLTLHSTVYKEWEAGLHPDLQPLPRKKTQFAENDVPFKGQERSEKYSAPLNGALALWMHGEKLKKPVESFFPFKMPRPSIPGDFVERLIQKYEQKRDAAFCARPEPSRRFVWLGGAPLVLACSGGGTQLCWSYMGELLYADVPKKVAQKVCTALLEISAARYSAERTEFCAERLMPVLGEKLFFELRGKGLCAL